MCQPEITMKGWGGIRRAPVIFTPMKSLDEFDPVFNKCSRLYCQIWQEPPWNEDFWTTEGVLADLKSELLMQCAEGFIAHYERPWPLYRFEYENPHNLLVLPKKPNNEKLEIVVGFTWGYMVNKEDMRRISGNYHLDYLFLSNKKIFYIDELGVGSKYRGHGIGKILSLLLIAAAESHNASILVLRTDEQAAMARKLYKSLRFKDLNVHDQEHPERTYLVLDID